MAIRIFAAGDRSRKRILRSSGDTLVIVPGMFLVIKYALTAGIVVLVSEAAKRSDKLGAIISSLPTVTILTLIWLYVEKQPQTKIANHAYYTFWYVLPTLPMFLVFPETLPRIGFWPSLVVAAVITFGFFLLTAFLAKRLGVSLL